MGGLLGAARVEARCSAGLHPERGVTFSVT
jgi:hypothetical protein